MDTNIIALIKFNGKNYTSWAYQFQVYLEGKELLCHITGSDPKPKEDDKKIHAWTTKDAKIRTWILGSVEPTLLLNLKPNKIAKDMWDCEKSLSSR